MSGEISSSKENATGAEKIAMPLLLLKAAARGDWRDLKRIFKLEGEVDNPDHSEVTVVPSDPASNTMEEIADYKYLQSVTHSGDNILHILVTKKHSDLAYMVFQKDRSLLEAPNKMGETPLHCAAKVANKEVVTKLIKQAPDDVKAAIRKKNCHGETALHVAARNGDEGVIDQLMQFDRQLALQVDNNGLSPLYTAAVERCTPAVQTMLKNDSRLVEIPNPDGLFLVHVAATTANTELISHIMENFPDSAQFTDSCERNLLHIAAEESKDEVLREVFALIKTDKHVSEMVAGMMNAKDNEGNTPLHLAAIKGHRVVMAIILDEINRRKEAVKAINFDIKNFKNLVANILDELKRRREAVVNGLDEFNRRREAVDEAGACELTRNNKGLTPFDLSFLQVKHNNKDRAYVLTNYVHREGRRLTKEWIYEIMNPSYQNTFERCQLIGLGAVLITTVAFAVAFTVPGGLNQNDGTPVLGRRYMFKAFTVANAFAFIQAFRSLFTLVMGGALKTPDMVELRFATFTFMSAASCMVVAFGLGSYVMLAPISKLIAIFVLVVALLFGSPSLLIIVLGERLLYRWLTFNGEVMVGAFLYYAPFFFIFLLPYHF